MFFLIFVCYNILNSSTTKALSVRALDVNISASSSCDDYRGCRTVWSITLSCFVVIFAWLWMVTCPDLPYPVETQDAAMGFWKKQLHKARIFFLEKLVLCIVGILYPEYLLVCAVQQRRDARNIAKEKGLRVAHGYFIVMGGFHVFEGSTPLHPLHRNSVFSLIQQNVIEPPIEADIQDKSKAEGLTRVLIFIQTLWFVVQTLSRAAKSLPITKLEVVAVAYVATYLLIYMISWEKPQKVNRPIRHQQIHFNGRRRPNSQIQQRYKPLSNHFYTGEGYGEGSVFAAALTVTMSGAIHCIAWTFSTPSFAEMVLWRLFSLGTFGSLLGPLACLFAELIKDCFLDKASLRRTKHIIYSSYWMVLVASGMLYSIARIALLVLAITDLRVAPHGFYEVVYWTTFIPHL